MADEFFAFRLGTEVNDARRMDRIVQLCLVTLFSVFQLPDEVLISTLNQRFPCREPQIRSLAALLHPHAAPCRNLILYGTEATGKSSIVEALLQNLHVPPPASAHAHDSDNHVDQQSLLSYAILNSIQCITARHLFERTLSAVADALHYTSRPKRCESMSQLTVELSRMLKDQPRSSSFRFVLVFDSIDRQRDVPVTLLPALARLPEIVSTHLWLSTESLLVMLVFLASDSTLIRRKFSTQIPSLTCVFVVTHPPAGFLRTSLVVPSIHFPNYTKSDFTKILSATPPATLPNTTDDDIQFLWPRFCNAVHDAVTASASRTLPSFRRACDALWPRFTAPILAGTHGPREFTKLVIVARHHFQDEALLNPSIISVVATQPTSSSSSSSAPTHTSTDNAAPTKEQGTPARRTSAATVPQTQAQPGTPDIAHLLPTTARLLLLAAYLASHNTARHDLTLFSTFHHGRRRRRGGRGGGYGTTTRRTKHRKIARKLLGAHAFVLERMMAIFAAVRTEWIADGSGLGIGAAGLDGDVGAAIATLASLRLLVRVGATADVMDRAGKWRVNVSWEVIRGVGRSIGVEVEDWLVE
ncbi:hypothetical protein ACRALDRAFT_1071683 [Sodiomyces alcalophilus JCM 7366]|uniref:uncharacterized protein n=1 Tax=Sodiomyces alcalophilus JCM 7366 TaxID=591952 RepID=UPI0039B546D4